MCACDRNCCAFVSHTFCQKSRIHVLVLTGLPVIRTPCVFTINLRVPDLHKKASAACAESSVFVVVVIFLLVPMCACLKEAGDARGHIKLLDFALCKFVHCSPTPTFPSAFMSVVDSAHYLIEMFDTSQT